MINFLDGDSRAQPFVQFLNRLIYDHYSVIYPKRKRSPLGEPLYRINDVLGVLAFACATKSAYPEKEIRNCSLEAIRQLPPTESIFKEWASLSIEGVVIGYCEKIDDIVYRLAQEKGEEGLCIRCPLFLRRTEITEALFKEIQKMSKEKDSINSSN
ncbi:MAG: hypothetical protein K6B65_01935 [Bacilli bacterium]|nr:hypothetical protein [Bacilli bacterium]